MSVVTSVILSMSCTENGFDVEENDTIQIDRINGFIRDHGKSDLHFLTPHMRNGKDPQTFTFGGGYNNFPNDEFLEFIQAIQWEHPENVVLVLQPEQGDTIVWRPLGYSTR